MIQIKQLWILAVAFTAANTTHAMEIPISKEAAQTQLPALLKNKDTNNAQFMNEHFLFLGGKPCGGKGFVKENFLNGATDFIGTESMGGTMRRLLEDPKTPLCVKKTLEPTYRGQMIDAGPEFAKYIVTEMNISPDTNVRKGNSFSLSSLNDLILPSEATILLDGVLLNPKEVKAIYNDPNCPWRPRGVIYVCSSDKQCRANLQRRLNTKTAERRKDDNLQTLNRRLKTFSENTVKSIRMHVSKSRIHMLYDIMSIQNDNLKQQLKDVFKLRTMELSAIRLNAKVLAGMRKSKANLCLAYLTHTNSSDRKASFKALRQKIATVIHMRGRRKLYSFVHIFQLDGHSHRRVPSKEYSFAFTQDNDDSVRLEEVMEELCKETDSLKPLAIKITSLYYEGEESSSAFVDVCQTIEHLNTQYRGA